MIYNIRYIVLFLSVLLVTAGCSTLKQQVVADSLPTCHILYDAGSGGTRLYIYEKTADNWLEHPGPKVGALADPVREFRGKKHSDIDAVTTEVVSALDGIRTEGTLDKTGKPKWSAFDWKNQCRVASVMVYGTAGMRIAEQKNRDKAVELLTLLKQKLQQKVGDGVKVSVRTLTGFEEGLYAWLTVREQQPNNHFGIVEMGGASSQITFPCPKCSSSDNATQTIRVKGEPIQMYSYSFLGLGQDEAPKTLGIPESCVYGVGSTQPHWQPDDCAKQIQIIEPQGIRDPYNFSAGKMGTHRQIPTEQREVGEWFLTGTFNDMDDKRIDNCCFNQNQCNEGASSCFRPVYFDRYLQTLNIPKTAEKKDVSWTLGVVVCTESDCLQQAKPLICNWTDKGCLTQ